MLILVNIFYFFIIVSSQINLDLTNLTNNGIYLHDCLYIYVKNEKETDPHQINTYCLTEWPSKSNIQIDNTISKYTFHQLSQQNITSEQLQVWSASIDMIENYQFYLNQLSISYDSFLGEEIFYNCTLPRFGNLCEYSLDIYDENISSLNDMIYNYYQQEYNPNELTCYIYLQCNSNVNISCLDWTQICDTFIDCYNSIDEKYCWQLELNKCEDNEYQCRNGQCISIDFFQDGQNIFECLDLDRTDDERIHNFFLTNQLNFNKGEPTFAREDAICKRILPGRSHTNITSSCVLGRDKLIVQSMFSNKPNSISADCWLAYTCILNEEYLRSTECEIYCSTTNCKHIIYNHCPEKFFFPNVPVVFGHIYFLYMKDFIYSSDFRIPRYICYNDRLCDGLDPIEDILLFNNMTCRSPLDLPIIIADHLYNSFTSMIRSMYLDLLQCNIVINSPIYGNYTW